MDSWERLFERTAKYDVALDEVRDALTERRDG
jgi:hypothetical protein